MARKKSTPKKLNLTHLESLTTNPPAPSEKPESENLKLETSDSEKPESENLKVEKIESENLKVETSDSEKPESENLKVEKIDSEKPESENLKVETTESDKPESEKLSSSASEVNTHTAKEKASIQMHPAPIREFNIKKLRTQHQDSKPPQAPTEATNEAGEVFTSGNKIKVSAPWGGKATAEIVSFYQDNDGSIWVQYNPQTSMADWQWHGGCTRASLLQKAM